MSFAYLLESFPDPTKTFVYREVAGAVRMGLEPHVFSIRTPSAEERELYQGDALPVTCLPGEPELRSLVEKERGCFSARQRRELSRWRGVKGDSTRVFEALWLGRELRRRKVRHVHAHFAGLAARTAWLLRRLWGISYSFTGHADDIFSPEPREISLQKLVEGADFIATETEYSRARLSREFPASASKVFRVFNGISEDSFDLRSKITGVVVPSPDAPPIVLSVGRLVEKKGFPTLLQAIRLLLDEGTKCELQIIGGGPLEQSLKEVAASLHLLNHVRFRGPQPQSVVRACLRSATVFALAAQTEGDGGSDNLPTVIMEAMAAELPVVSTLVAGIPEMVDEGETGMLCEPGNAPAMAATLRRYLMAPELARAHGKRGAVCAREKFLVSESVRALAVLLARKSAVSFPKNVRSNIPDLRVPWTLWLAKRLFRRVG